MLAMFYYLYILVSEGDNDVTAFGCNTSGTQNKELKNFLVDFLVIPPEWNWGGGGGASYFSFLCVGGGHLICPSCVSVCGRNLNLECHNF